MSDVALAEHVDAVERKVEEVEQRVEAEKRSWSRRSTVLASTLALLISILSGGFNVYDQAVLRPSQAAEDSLAELRRTVSRLTEINWKLAELEASSPNTVRTVQMIANGEKVSLLQRADQIVDALGPRVGLSEYITLAVEHLSFGEGKRAIRYAEAAVALAGSPGLRAEAMRYRARALFMPGPTQDIEAARATYAEGLTVAAEMAELQSPGILISFYTDWALNESLFGDCDRIVTLRQAFIDALTQMRATQDAMNTAYASFTGALRAQNRCPVPM